MDKKLWRNRVSEGGAFGNESGVGSDLRSWLDLPWTFNQTEWTTCFSCIELRVLRNAALRLLLHETVPKRFCSNRFSSSFVTKRHFKYGLAVPYKIKHCLD